jgi:hypothetical protein
MGFVGGETEEQICTFHGVLIHTLSFHAFAPPTNIAEETRGRTRYSRRYTQQEILKTINKHYIVPFVCFPLFLGLGTGQTCW